MLPLPADLDGWSGVVVPVYRRHRPERIFLDQLVHEYCPALKAYLAAQGMVLLGYSWVWASLGTKQSAQLVATDRSV